MRSTFACGVAVFLVIFVGGSGSLFQGSTGPIPLNCNRACLENVVEQYLTALIAHDPKKPFFSADVKYTENSQVLPLGDGFWKTVQGRGKYTHIFADPEFGQVAFMGTMMEAGAPLLMSLRLRIELGRITEVETVFFKPGGGGPNNMFKLGYYFVVQNIHNRGYPVVDQERGIVYAHSVFDQGTVNQGVLSTGQPYTFSGFNRPSSILVTEAFLIENGKIRHVEMIGTSAPYHINSPWGGLSGN